MTAFDHGTLGYVRKYPSAHDALLVLLQRDAVSETMALTSNVFLKAWISCHGSVAASVTFFNLTLPLFPFSSLK